MTQERYSSWLLLILGAFLFVLGFFAGIGAAILSAGALD